MKDCSGSHFHYLFIRGFPDIFLAIKMKKRKQLKNHPDIKTLASGTTPLSDSIFFPGDCSYMHPFDTMEDFEDKYIYAILNYKK